MTTKYEDLSNADLDRLIAERVMKWGHSGADWAMSNMMVHAGSPQFSTSFDTCLEHVIPAMRERDMEINVHDVDAVFLVGFSKPISSNRLAYKGEHKSLPRATCIAALLALDSQEKANDPS